MKSGNSDQLMLSVGALLAATREQRGIPIERAAKDTRMRPQRIRDMENDDLSHFTNPSYARMFLIAYAKYLDIPMQTIREHLPDAGEPGSEGYQYINTSSEDLPSLRRDLGSKTPRRNGWLIGIGVSTLLLILGGIGFIVFYATVNADRLMAALDRPPPPEPEAKVVVVENVQLANLKDGEEIAAAAFAETVSLNTPPPTPAPVSHIESEATLVEPPPVPSEGVEATSLPEPATVLGDREFLLGTSPGESEPAAVP